VVGLAAVLVHRHLVHLMGEPELLGKVMLVVVLDFMEFQTIVAGAVVVKHKLVLVELREMVVLENIHQFLVPTLHMLAVVVVACLERVELVQVVLVAVALVVQLVAQMEQLTLAVVEVEQDTQVETQALVDQV
jgi:hypothetical protein